MAELAFWMGLALLLAFCMARVWGCLRPSYALAAGLDSYEIGRNTRVFLHKAAMRLLSGSGNKIKVLGPAPAVLSRIDKVYRYSMILKSNSPKAIGGALTEIRKLSTSELPSSYRCIIDVDPVNML